jgi:hypothetical protein
MVHLSESKSRRAKSRNMQSTHVRYHSPSLSRKANWNTVLW